MKIILTGGGTGGHVYPIIAVAEAINRIASQEGVVGVELYFASDAFYDKDAMLREHLRFIEVKSGKERTYFSIQNYFDKFKTLFAVIKMVFKLFVLYPDVVFGKGGFVSFPAVCAARILRIPVIIHESDIIPGKVNRWAAEYAEKIAVSYPEAIAHFGGKENRIALTGNPIRASMMNPIVDGSHEFFGFDPSKKTILVMGGSLGAERINESFVDVLPRLLEDYQVIHQTGKENALWMKKRTEGLLRDNPNADKYKLYPFLDEETLTRAAGVADFVISRAGSTIFEIALWGKPSILIPLPIARDDHQRENAYSYARTGAAIVLEEANLKPELFYTVLHDTLEDAGKMASMAQATASFAHRDAAEKIARALIATALTHE